jgi:hypothetical protein
VSHRLSIIGDTYGELTVTAFAGVSKNKTLWVCRCSCGEVLTVKGNALRTGNTKSCGHLVLDHAATLNRTHGCSGTRTHRIWKAMWTRCTNPRQRGAKHYVSRGITVCERWASFENFLADMGEAPPRCSIDRKDVNGNYEPGNCRWATYRTQARNSRGKGGGVRGVHWMPERNKWRVVICSGKDRWHLGVFEDYDQAVAARKAGEVKHWRST